MRLGILEKKVSYELLLFNEFNVFLMIKSIMLNIESCDCSTLAWRNHSFICQTNWDNLKKRTCQKLFEIHNLVFGDIDEWQPYADKHI